VKILLISKNLKIKLSIIVQKWLTMGPPRCGNLGAVLNGIHGKDLLLYQDYTKKLELLNELIDNILNRIEL
jgi:hypothetical protein